MSNKNESVTTDSPIIRVLVVALITRNPHS
jgi:hypothetical protein